jgi:NADPH:quinone reductase-like Zn-dependent oxidoreductase
MPGQASFAEAAGLVIGGGTAYEGLADRGGCNPDRPCSSPPPRGRGQRRRADRGGHRGPSPGRDHLESLGASEVFDYHAVGWAQQVRAAVPGGVDLLLDGAGGQTRGQALARSVTAAGRSSWSCKVLPPSSSAASPASRSPPTSTGRGWSNWAAWSMPASCGPRSGAVLPLEQVREALTRVTGRHTRGKIVLQIAL